MIILYDINKKELIIEEAENAVEKLYYLEAKIPSQKEIETNIISENTNDKIKKYFEKYGIKKGIRLIKKNLSKNNTKIPLYDVYSENIYLIGRDNVYDRVVYQYYRFPTKELFNKLLKKQRKSKNIHTDDPLQERKNKKLSLMIKFLKSFDLDELYKTYMTTYYLYSDEVGKNISVCRRPSFLPHFLHLKPYYTRSDVINIALNMGLINKPGNSKCVTLSEKKIDDKTDNKIDDNIDELCDLVTQNDISAEMLLKHQNYMIKEDKVGLIQYYTLQGSYFMNQYLRGLGQNDTRNIYLESLITPMWKLINNAPAFDKDYILYRFISSDNHLRQTEIGDIYTEQGFVSTTRDPFYRSDTYKFGFILIKIKIPKNVIGVALCVETLSHFPDEQEIILSPLSQLRLDKRDSKCVYYNSDKEFATQVKTRYEFTYIGKKDIKFNENLPMPTKQDHVDFLKVDDIETISLEEKIRYFISKYVNELYQFNAKVGDKTFTILTERYDSTGAYKNFFAMSNQNGFLMYTLYDNYILFMLEMGELQNSGGKYMHVNYYVKYSTLNKEKIFSDEQFIKFISSVAYYFNIDRIILWAEFKACDIFKNNINNNLNRSHNTKEDDITTKNSRDRIINPFMIDIYNNNNDKIQRGFINNKTLASIEADKGTNINLIEEVTETDTNTETEIIDPNTNKVNSSINSNTIGGGTFCVDFYNYFKSKNKRYETISRMELQPKFSYYMLDKLRSTNVDKILIKSDLDEIYQIYDKIYKQSLTTVENDNIADFYIWMIENRCYLIDLLNKKMKRIMRIDNPFESFYYVLDPLAYLYNRRFIDSYPSYTIHGTTIYESNKQEITPKNRYRIAE